MHLERRTVSRKTPNDGRLEITKRAAEKVERLADGLHVEIGGARVPAKLGTMDCTCRGVDNPHVHYFIESAPFKHLTPGADVDLDLDLDAKVVHVAPAK